MKRNADIRGKLKGSVNAGKVIGHIEGYFAAKKQVNAYIFDAAEKETNLSVKTRLFHLALEITTKLQRPPMEKEKENDEQGK